MATTKAQPKTAVVPAETTDKYEGLSSQQLIDIYRLMYMSRKLDDREILLKRQQKIFFQISGAGHEALLVAAGLALRPSYDWFYPYYRDRALCLALGMTPYEQLLEAVGAADDPNSGGRQMPSHWGHKKLNIVSQSSPTGTQFLQAVGCAEAGRYFSNNPKSAEKAEGDYRQFKDVAVQGRRSGLRLLRRRHHQRRRILGGAELRLQPEAAGALCHRRQRVRHLGSGRGRHGRRQHQQAGAGLPQFPLLRDRWHRSLWSAMRPSRRRSTTVAPAKGPAFVHGHVIRPYSHSLSDDEKLYRPDSERQSEVERDPITRFQLFLVREGILDEKGVDELEKDVEAEIQEASDRAVAAALPEPGSYVEFVYSPDLDPTSSEFQTEAVHPAPSEKAPEKTMADLINACLKDEMKRDPRIVMFGEDVADCSREEYLKAKQVKGKGGVFKLTAGLQAEFGYERVFNSPLAEANIVGRAVGMATRGLKPVVEIQFFDYIWPAMQQLRNELPLMRWRSNNNFSSPAVVRVAIGGYLTGGSIYHSQCGESIFTHTPGMRVVFPSNALDANGLLRTAIRCDDPVLFLEHKRLYRETFGRAPYPGPDYMVPFGKAKVVRPGHDLTVVTYGAVVPRALQAAQRLERENGVSVELIDLRTLSPYDWEAIATSVSKTSRVIVAHEDMLSWGYGAEIAARIADELFDQLDAPVKRVAAKDTFVAYQPILEDEILPQAEDLYQAMEQLANY